MFVGLPGTTIGWSLKVVYIYRGHTGNMHMSSPRIVPMQVSQI